MLIDNNSLDNFDVRLLSSAAKVIFELETLIKNENLRDIEYVSSNSTIVKSLGSKLRVLSQEKLLNALKDKNQASVASSLQIFYNLQSLPEIVLLAIDVTVKNAMEISSALIDVDMLAKSNDPKQQGSVNGKKTLNKTKIDATKNTTSNPLQLKLILKETAHTWASSIYDQVLRIHVLQKVLMKKEDPSTHKRFVEVLKQIENNGSDESERMTADPVTSKSHFTNLTNVYLAKGDLISLFWSRFAASLQDVSI